jgi:copper transport protein
VRRAPIALAALVLLLCGAGSALGHPYLVSTSPASEARLAASPRLVELTFNEPVEVLRGQDVEVVDEEGTGVTSGPPSNEDDASVVRVPLRPGLADGTYTIRYQVIGGDSHVVPGALVFGVGSGELAEPYLEGSRTAGPSETGPWGISSRFLELVGLGGLIGLLAFRWLVWAPVAGRAGGVGAGERTSALNWWRDLYWVAFGVLAVGAMLAEGYLLLVQSASVLGTGVLDALRNASGVGQVLGDTRFGSLVQLRGALLFVLFAVGAVQFMREYGSAGTPRPPSAGGSPVAGLIMAALLLSVLGGIATQGHASVAELSTLQVGAQLVHIVAVAVWISGIALIALVHVRLPKVIPDGGPALAAQLLARFSRVALIAVAVAVLSGVIRTLGELDDPAELWDTAWGRSVLIKLALLCPIAFLGLYNRKVVAALRRVSRPNRPTLALVRRTAGAELVLSLAIAVVASLLVAQVPGGA